MSGEICNSKKYVIPLTPSCDFGKNVPIEIIINNYCCDSCKHCRRHHKRHHKKHCKRYHEGRHENHPDEYDKSTIV